MIARNKQLGFGGGKLPGSPGSWLVGLVVGMTVTNLAAGAMAFGTSAAVRKAILGKQVPGRSAYLR